MKKKLLIPPITKPILFWSISLGILYTATTTLLSSADEETAIALFFFKLGKESQQFKINTLSTQLIQKESRVKYKFDDSNLIQETLLDSIRMYDALTEGQNISRDSYGRAKGLGDARWKRAKELLIIIQAISKNSELIDTNRDRVINNLKKQIAFQRTSI